jgi:hypothetical protein
MSDERNEQRWDWALLWRGVKPQLFMLVIIAVIFAALIWLTATQTARE